MNGAARWRGRAAIAGVAIAASIVGIGNAFAYDDVKLVQENVRLHTMATWGEILGSPFWPPPYQPDLYRPLTALFLSAQHIFGAGDPTIFRVTSYLLYAAASLSVLRFAQLIVPSAMALAIALVFAAHPVHVEAVALAVGQAELLVAIISTLAVAGYVTRRRRGSLSWGNWAALAGAYAVASLCKEQGLLLPALILIAELLLVGDRTQSPSDRIKNLRRGMGLLSLVGIGILLIRRMVLGGVAGSFAAEAIAGASFGTRALTVLRLIPAWLRLLLWPAHLQADYSPQEIVASHTLGGIEILGLLLLVVTLALAWRVRRSAPAVTFGVAWMAVTLLPVSNLVVPTGIVLAERILFLPSIGFLIATGGMLSHPRIRATIEETLSRFSRESPMKIAMVAVTVLVALGVIRSAERQRIWRNDAIFAVRTVQDAPLSYRAQQSYGDVAFAVNQPRLANEAYRRALELSPPAERWRVHNHFARGLATLGDRQAEVEQLRASLAQRPDQEDTRGLLIAAELGLGRYDVARREADSALARGGTETFRGLRRLADSAATAGAPAGSINVLLSLGNFQRSQ